MAGDGPQWHVYIVRCADGTLYPGAAMDVATRVAAHNGPQSVGIRGARAVRAAGNRGARYTRARRPVKLVYQERAANRSAACRREYRIKQLTRAAKEALVSVGAQRADRVDAGRAQRRRQVRRRGDRQ